MIKGGKKRFNLLIDNVDRGIMEKKNDYKAVKEANAKVHSMNEDSWIGQ